LRKTLESGAAAEHFDRMVVALGGPRDFVRSHDRHLARADIVRPVHAGAEGCISSIRTRDLGLAVIELGGGRRVASDRIDHRVGLSGLLGKGASVDSETPLCTIHASDEASFDRAAAIIRSAYVIGEAPAPTPNVWARIAA
jgi:thymidine phosphorylase